MYILRNAFKCIGRSMGRNILIGIITLVLAVSACIGLSIRQAAESAKNETLAGMSVTASISIDRQAMMGNMDKGTSEESGGGFDRNQFSAMMGNAASLTLEEYEKYAGADSVRDFYYTRTASFDGSEDLEPVSTEEDTESDVSDQAEAPGNGGYGGKGGMMGGARGNMAGYGDFSVIGYSSETAMTAFADGTASVTDGEVFEEGTAERSCLISEELAIYNGLAVGDTITLTNPNSEEESYELTVAGIYTSSETNDVSMSRFGSGQDPANKIYMSAEALQGILDDSAAVSTVLTDEESGMEYETAVTGSLAATYVFAGTEDYYRFEEEVRDLGLSDTYTVSSSDVSSYEKSITPLNTLSEMAGWFLVVILIIGAVILIVLNIFNVRERKYEIGVLTAMGMKKGKVAVQFLTEIFVVTMISVILGAGIGAASSVPVTNALLANQVESQQSQQEQQEYNFGRGGKGDMVSADGAPAISGGKASFGSFFGTSAVSYISEVDSAMNLTVVFQMLGIGLLLTLAAGAVSVLFVMRYDPLKILANRD